MNHGICTFCTKRQSGKSMNHGICTFCTKRQSGKSMNHGICTFCTKRQKWQKYESWDLHFLYQEDTIFDIQCRSNVITLMRTLLHNCLFQVFELSNLKIYCYINFHPIRIHNLRTLALFWQNGVQMNLPSLLPSLLPGDADREGAGCQMGQDDNTVEEVCRL